MASPAQASTPARTAGCPYRLLILLGRVALERVVGDGTAPLGIHTDQFALAPFEPEFVEIREDAGRRAGGVATPGVARFESGCLGRGLLKAEGVEVERDRGLRRVHEQHYRLDGIEAQFAILGSASHLLDRNHQRVQSRLH